MFTPLNWKEIALLAEQLQREVRGLFLERIIVPARPRFPGGYLKSEWMLRFSGGKREASILVGLRPKIPYLALCPGKGPSAEAKATRSPFDQQISKELKDRKFMDAEALHRDRTLILWFAGENGRLGLVLSLIPASPEALLIEETTDEKLSIIVRSRTGKPPGFYSRPTNSKAPEGVPIREEISSSPQTLYKQLENELETTAFEMRLQIVQKVLQETKTHAKDRQRQSEVTLKEANREPDWGKFGNLLKASLRSTPDLVKNGKIWVRSLLDYETGETIDVPCDPKLSPKDQVEKFFQMARRKTRKLEEASSRRAHFDETERDFGSIEMPRAGDWKALEELEARCGLSYKQTADTDVIRKTSTWPGKVFSSKEGLTFYVGRSKDENLELTFKHARGNDLWLHVRGRPGSHVIIPLQAGRSAPLETLLDAANLCIYFSGGESWGKTEVDYTFKKFVKRIKDSSEASYTRNKTLIVEPDSARIKRLLSQGSGK